MKITESPGAVAAHGALEEIDQLGSRIDAQNSLNSLPRNPLRLRAGIHPRNHASTIAAVFARVLFGGKQTNRSAIMKNSKALKKPNAAPLAVQYDNPWLEAAAEAGSEFGKLLKFVKGEWQIGEDTVAEGTEFIAYIDELARAWIKFEDQSVADRRIVKIAMGHPPERRELGDTDASEWEVGEDGKPRDPWVMQWLLPMSLISAEGDLTVFATSSKGGIGAIGTLCQVYGRSPRNGLLPIVALKCASYKHLQYGKVLKPDLPIIGWHGTATTPSAPAVTPVDDEIPY